MERKIISVYKTNISEKDLIWLKAILDDHKKIIKWSIDLEDWENILRIESLFAIEKEIKSMLNDLKLMCVELN